MAGTTTTHLGLYKPERGERGWDALVNANFDTLDTAVYDANRPFDAVQHVRPTGSNSNDGRSWGTAKKDILGAFDELPTSGGTIYFESGSYVDSSNTDRGLWIGGANDNQYASLPTGWRQAKPLRLVGIPTVVSSGTTGGLTALLNGGSPTDTAKPLFWFSGINAHISVENASNQALAKGMILGLDSDGSGTTNNSNLRFKNVALRCEQNASYGPVVDITTAYWTWFENCTFSANEQATWDDDKRAAILIRGNGLGEGLIYVKDCEFNGGCGVKQYSSASVQITVERCTQEGATTGDTTSAPVYWLASKGVTVGHAHIISVEQADAATRQPCVKVATGNDPSVVVVAGAKDVEGPATVLATYKNTVDELRATSPAGHKQVGFKSGRVFGRTDAARRLGSAVSPHVKNLAPQDVTTWSGLSGAATVTTGITDPYGGTNAATLSGSSVHRTLYAATPSPAIASGDWVVFGIWARLDGTEWPANRPQFNITGSGNLFDLGNSTTGTNVSLEQPWLGDGDWMWLIEARKISALPAAVSINCNIYASTDASMSFAYPVFCVIPTATYSDSEALAMVESLSPWSNDSLVTAGELTTLKEQRLHALGGLRVEGANLDAGSGSPEGVVTSGVGSMFLRKDGGAATVLYMKESGTGNTGWTAYDPGGGSPGASIVTVARKTSDTTRNATATPADDAELLFSMVANGIYFFEGWLRVTSVSTNSDFRVKWDNIPAGATAAWGGVVGTTSVPGFSGNLGTASSPIALRPAGTELDFGGFNGTYGIAISGQIFNGANAGDAVMRWSQASSTAEDTILLANSFLRITHLNA
jgi:hypothetical protein